jgi:hypothetical protein
MSSQADLMYMPGNENCKFVNTDLANRVLHTVGIIYYRINVELIAFCSRCTSLVKLLVGLL